MYRLLTALMALLLLTACGETQLHEEAEDLGAFRVRVAHVYSEKALQWPMSRAADQSEWVEPMKRALETRLRRYSGPQEYDVAVTLEGFMLAPPGIPIVFAPKSVAVVNVFVYDVERKVFLAKKEQMEIFEDTTGESAILGSGHIRSKEDQIAGLSLNIADKVEEWLAEQHKENGWFALRSAAEVEPATTGDETSPPVSE
ncbi:MAG: hypothetical protein MRY81_11455 [Donghicola eburneus]|nr:hypothetical protein [Donghicola eburneus]MCI5040286.1 hypothetical protein [Donghicola eburneus]